MFRQMKFHQWEGWGDARLRSIAAKSTGINIFNSLFSIWFLEFILPSESRGQNINWNEYKYLFISIYIMACNVQETLQFGPKYVPNQLGLNRTPLRSKHFRSYVPSFLDLNIFFLQLIGSQLCSMVQWPFSTKLAFFAIFGIFFHDQSSADMFFSHCEIMTSMTSNFFYPLNK